MSFPVTLANCDQEPIHTPGLIQPFGIFVGLSDDGHSIQCISTNSVSLLKDSIDLVSGAYDLESLFRDHSIQDLKESISTLGGHDGVAPKVYMHAIKSDARFEVFPYRNCGKLSRN